MRTPTARPTVVRIPIGGRGQAATRGRHRGCHARGVIWPRDPGSRRSPVLCPEHGAAPTAGRAGGIGARARAWIASADTVQHRLSRRRARARAGMTITGRCTAACASAGTRSPWRRARRSWPPSPGRVRMLLARQRRLERRADHRRRQSVRLPAPRARRQSQERVPAGDSRRPARAGRGSRSAGAAIPGRATAKRPQLGFVYRPGGGAPVDPYELLASARRLPAAATPASRGRPASCASRAS